MMKQLFQTATPPTDPNDATRRNTAIRINLVTGLLLLAVSVPTLVTLTPEVSLNYIGNIVTLVMSLLAFASAWISYRYSPTRGSLLFIGTLLLISLGIPLYANGLGLQSGIIVAVIVVSVAATTLPAQLAARVSVVAVAIEAGVILMDLYLPDFGLGELESVYINPFLFVIILVFAYYVWRQYSTYTFRAKLIIFFVLIAVIAVSAVAIVTNSLARNEIVKQVGQNEQSLAERLALETGKELEAQVEKLQSASTQFKEIAVEANSSYTDSRSQIIDQVVKLDERWRAAPDNDALIQGVLNNRTADKLLEFRNIFPNHVELFLTDQYGANIAATNRTSDYYQADEDWWKLANNLGRGGVYIGQPAFDESSQTYSIIIAIPVYSEGKVVGILRSTLSVEAILENLRQSILRNIEGVDLRTGNLTLLGSDPINPDELIGLSNVMFGYGEITYKGKPSLVSQHRIFSSAKSSSQNAVSELGWSIIVYQDLDEALQPVEEQTRAITLIAMIIMVLAGLLGLFASQRLAAPITALTTITTKVSAGDLNARAPVQTQDEIGALSDSFNRMTNQLQDTLKGLEQRVAERTVDLNAARLQSEERAQNLQSISEISRIISSEQRLDILLPLITRLVSEKFNFYHAGIFFVDDSRRFAVLQASNSEGGQRMLNRGHRLEVGQTGIVGNVALTGKPRIALDVGADAVFFDNPDLPATRSEMALPLNVRGATIGVLDVQSTKAGEFTESDASTLGVLADQIAIAIENARLFAKTQQALSETQTLYNQYLQKEWKSFRSESVNVGYQQSLIGGRPLKALIESDEIRMALRKGEILLVNEEAQTEPSIVVPIKLRGQTIGVLNIKASGKNHQWSKDEINMIESVSDRLALALENARLFEETTRRAERERLVSDITGKMRSVNDPQAMIQTAMEELRNALGASRVQVIPQATKEPE